VAGESSKIYLTTPATDGKVDPDTITKPNALHNWADNLPYANPLGTAQATLASLKLLNRHPGKINQRADLMLIYMDPFRRIIDMARKLSYLAQSRQNQTRESSEILALTGMICTEMSYGFKHVVNAEATTRTKTTHEDLASHIQLAMHGLALGLMFEMSSYRAESRSAWREIFQLLTRAEQLGVTNLTIPETTLQVDYEVSVLNTFKCILLTSILDSSRLMPEETWASYDYLQWHAKNARLTPVEQASARSGNYLVPRDGLVKPVLYDSENKPADQSKYMICETHKLNLQVNRHLEILSTDESAFIQGTDHLTIDSKRQILRQMLHIWYTNPKRRHKRTDKFDRLSCAFGVSSVYSYIKNGSMRIKSDLPLSGEGQNNFNSNYLTGHPEEPKLSGGLHCYEFRQENVSTSGTGILSPDPDINNLKTGQLIVIESKLVDTPGKMRVGVVRRIARQGQTTKEVGVQYLPGRLFPATVMPEIFGRKHKADLQPCLLLELGESQPKAIITPHLIYQANRHYIMDIANGDTKQIIAGKLLESTCCFDCFEYDILQHN